LIVDFFRQTKAPASSGAFSFGPEAVPAISFSLKSSKNRHFQPIDASARANSPRMLHAGHGVDRNFVRLLWQVEQ
jgi:hypothetical protein